MGWRVAVALVLLLVVASAPWTQIPSDNADGAGMLAHLHAFLEGGDLIYDDEYAELGMSPLFAFVTERSQGGRGVVSNHWPFGATLLQAPGWLLGRGAAELLVALGQIREGSAAARWTIPLLGLRAWALLILGGIGLTMFRWLRSRELGPTLTWLGLGFSVLGTPLIYYAAEAPMRPHLWGAVVVCVLVMRWTDAVEAARLDSRQAVSKLGEPLVLASLAGLAAAIRPQLAPLCLLIAYERWVATGSLRGAERWRRLLVQGAATATVWIAWPLLILRVQWWMYGGVGDYGGEVSHHLRAFLFSPHHGALVWCPVLVLGLLGLGLGIIDRQRGAGLLLTLVFMQIWLDSGTREITPYTVLGTRTWTAGTAFGPRKLMDALPLLLPGVLWIQGWLDGREAKTATRWRWSLAVVGGVSITVTGLLLLAAWLDPHVTSTVMDWSRFRIALSLPFDGRNWVEAWARRSVPVPMVAAVALVVCLPVSVLGLALATRTSFFGPPPLPEGSTLASHPRRPWSRTRAVSAQAGVRTAIAAPILAHLWLSILWLNSETILADHPERMKRAAQAMNPWHEALVRSIPEHTQILRERLGEDAI